MKFPARLLKWASGLFQNFAVGLFMLGLGTLLFQDAATNNDPVFFGSLFVVLSWVLVVFSGLIEVWLVIRDKGK